MAPRVRKRSTMATPSAPPSIGSVPDPTSSSSTSAGVCRSRSIDTMLLMCAENVLRLASIDCSSPMSAKTDRNTGTREPSAAGIRRPACAIIARRPAVLSATVLPPVFGPVMSSTVDGGITLMVTERVRGVPRVRRFVLRPDARPTPSADAAQPAARSARRSTARVRSRRSRRKTAPSPAARRVRRRPPSCGRGLPPAGETRRSTRAGCDRTSSCSCSSRATMSLLISTVLSGSRNRLAPLVDEPCTMPGMAPRCSALTTST